VRPLFALVLPLLRLPQSRPFHVSVSFRVFVCVDDVLLAGAYLRGSDAPPTAPELSSGACRVPLESASEARTIHLKVRGWWRRRESNPRPKTSLRETLQA
jgi:hypothetical protein